MSTWCQNTICHYVIMQLFCLCIKWKVVQTWQPDNLTTWQPDNTLTVSRVCLSFRHFCTLNANPYTQYHDYSDNYLDVYSDNYLDDYSDNYLDDYCYDYREACTLNLIYQFHLWKHSFPCLPNPRVWDMGSWYLRKKIGVPLASQCEGRSPARRWACQQSTELGVWGRSEPPVGSSGKALEAFFFRLKYP